MRRAAEECSAVPSGCLMDLRSDQRPCRFLCHHALYLCTLPLLRPARRAEVSEVVWMKESHETMLLW